MGVYINGEIYIKKNPDIFSIENNPLLDNILNLTDTTVSLIEDQDAIDELNSMRSSLLEDMKRREGTLDYSRCNKFYRLITNGNDVILSSVGMNTIDTIVKYSSFEDMSEDYESLSDFLDTALFVGRHCKSSSPLANLLSIKCIALYKKGDTIINKLYDDYGNEKYDILSADEVLNDEIVFTDEIDYTYDNRSEVYKNIRKQFSEGHGRRLQ
mgnify:FL=1